MEEQPFTAEPTSYVNLVVFGLSFACYFLGIFIRKKCLPQANSPALQKQLLLGIPVSFIVVPPLLLLMQKNFTMEGLPSFLVVLGIIIEHGMIVNETAVKHLEKLREQITTPTPPRN